MAADLYFRGEIRSGDVWVERAARGAAAFRAAGLGAGRKLAVLLPNCFEYPEVLRAIGLAGSYAVPLSTHLSDVDLAALLARERFDALIASEELFARCKGSEPSFRILVGDGPNKTWDGFVASAQVDPEEDGTPPGAMFFTSGSTRLPKTVVRSPLPPAIARLSNARFQKAWGMEPGMRTVITGPIYHQAPLYYLMGSAVCAERVVILESFSALDVLEAVSAHAVTHLHMVPRLMHRLAALSPAEREGHDVSSIRFVLHGAAPCPAGVKRALIAWWGPVFREYYSASEFGSISQIDTAEWLLRPTSVGRPSPGVEIRVAASLDGPDLPIGQVGRLFVRSDAMPTFSYRGDGGTPSYELVRGDWVTVNDIGWLDHEGYIHLDGRSDDVAVISGVNIGSMGTLCALLELPYVQDAMVQIVPDPERGSAFAAIIVLRPGTGDVAPDRIRSDLRSKLASLAVPRDVMLRPSLPVFDTGKTVPRYLDGHNPR